MNLADIALHTGRAPSLMDKSAFFTSTGSITNRDFQERVRHVAVGLQALHVKPGDKVLVRLTNSIEFAASFLALVWLGAVPVLQNSQFGESEMEHIIALTAPVGVLVAEGHNEPAIARFASYAWRAAVGPTGLSVDGQALAESKNWPALYDARSDDPSFIVFTSGTTGRPKGIVHAHRWLDALGNANRERIPPQPDDVVLATGEWSFISALGHNVLFPLRNGIAAAILEDRASPERILATVGRDRVTLLYSVATLYRRILGQSGIEHRFDVSSLRGVNATGEPLEETVRAEWQKRFGCPVWEHFGISEAQMVIGHSPLVPYRNGTVGVPWGVKAFIVDDELASQPAGTTGRLAFNADYPGFFLGYLGDKVQTEAVFRGSWYMTSDLARIDSDGYVAVLGRADDCFKSKGVLIVPRELEEALLGLGRFEEACVFPINDKEIGHRIGAAIVLRQGESVVDENDIAFALKGRIAPFKFPHKIFLLNGLPKNANGKTQRSALVKLLVG